MVWIYTFISVLPVIPSYTVISPASDCFSICLTLRLSSNLPCRYIIFVTIASTVESWPLITWAVFNWNPAPYLHLHAARQALADVYDVHASVGSFIQQSHDPWGMRGISPIRRYASRCLEGPEISSRGARCCPQYREETEHDHVRVESPGWGIIGLS